MSGPMQVSGIVHEPTGEPAPQWLVDEMNRMLREPEYLEQFKQMSPEERMRLYDLRNSGQ